MIELRINGENYAIDIDATGIRDLPFRQHDLRQLDHRETDVA